MKVPYSWLENLVEIDHSIEEISEKLSIGGFEVEDINDFSTQAKNVVVGFVEKVEPHPNADKLNICKVDIGQKNKLQIVCGASNIKSNVHVLVAKPGATLSSIGLEIKTTKLREVTSEGMICSLSELGLEAKSTGIYILEENQKTFPKKGESVLSFFDLEEKVIELAITANRPDGLSMTGIAREVSSLFNKNIKLPIIKTSQTIEIVKNNDINQDIIENNGIYSITKIKDINQEINTPKWLKNRLENSGIKSINLVVDITNYVMLEQGQPLHAFDLDLLEKLTGKKVDYNSFGVRTGRDGETLIGLDNKKHKLNNQISIITCHDHPIAVAGVIGSLNTSVSTSTKNIFLEAALFTASSVRLSSRKLGLRTESSTRYEKGISPEITIPAINRYIDILDDYCKFDIHNTIADKKIIKKKNPIILRKKRINSILGPKKSLNQHLNNDEFNMKINTYKKESNYIEIDEIETKLSLLGCNFKRIDDDWSVIVPSYRSLDLLREIDLIEEIARLIGYDKFESSLPNPIKPGGLSPSQIIERKVCHGFSSSGFQEVITSSLVASSIEEKNRIKISNPLLADTSCLRTNLWEEHLDICNRNITYGQSGCWIFEIGTIYSNSDNKYKEKKVICGAITGERRFEKWTSNGKSTKLNYYEARGLLEQSLFPLNIKLIDKTLDNDNILHPGRSANLYLEGKSIGRFGQIHPLLLDKYEFDRNTYIFELMLSPIINSASRNNNWIKTYKKYPTVPYMERDIALLVNIKVKSQDIILNIKKSGKPLLEKVELIDSYKGKSIPEDKISMAFRIRYRDIDKTLKDNDINPIHERIRKSLKDQLQAELRS